MDTVSGNMRVSQHDNYNRRDFLKIAGAATGTVLLSSVVAAPLHAQLGQGREAIPAITDSSVRALVFQGIQAARDAGASYAEVRLTHDIIRDVSIARINDAQTIYASVRALVNGQWGLASGPVWDTEALTALGRRSALQAAAQAAAMGKGIDFEALPQREIIRDAHWHMPVKIDPLSVHPFVVQDFLQGLSDQIHATFADRRNAQAKVALGVKFFVQERAFGTSDESYCTQRVYMTSGTMTGSLNVRKSNGAADGGTRNIHLVTPTSQGWELFTDQPLYDAVVNNIHDIQKDTSLPVEPVTPGKSALLLDAATVARVVSQTIGAASELDRALGYEANVSGSSYLHSPATMLDKYALGSSMLTVTANRSDPGGAATVQWDDEGVAPQPFTIVKDGVFHDYHTSREGVTWLKQANIAGRERPYGVVNAVRGADKPYIQTANLELTPAATQADATEVTYQAQDGIMFEDATVNMDASRMNGVLGWGRAYEIRNGKKVARIVRAVAVFHTPTLWNSLYLLGGSDSQVRSGLVATKGEPQQQSYHSVTAVPAAFRDQQITDITLR